MFSKEFLNSDFFWVCFDRCLQNKIIFLGRKMITNIFAHRCSLLRTAHTENACKHEKKCNHHSCMGYVELQTNVCSPLVPVGLLLVAMAAAA